MYTDYKNLATFITKKELNKRQIRWIEFLSEFYFVIIYRKGNKNGRADSLSRRLDLKEKLIVEIYTILTKDTNGNLILNK